jgi:ribosome-associated translation inhibitor RaiA
MQIQVNTDNHIVGSAELTRQVESTVQSALARFSQRITRVEVHLSDVNSSQKTRGDDIRCAIEARLGGLQPITVSKNGPTVEVAVDNAVDTLEKTLNRTLERLDGAKGRDSFAGDQS